MKVATCHLKSITPYSQNGHYTTPKEPRELDDAYEARTWRERCTTDHQGQLIIPPMAFNNCIRSAAQYLSLSIPGKGQQKYTKHFNSGILVSDPLPLGIRKEDVEMESVFVPSNGQRGSGKRVTKHFPVVKEWEGDIIVYLLDDIITQDVFHQVLVSAGQLIGVGRFRPQSQGYYGRFQVERIDWSEA